MNSYQPSGLWAHYDFLINKTFWEKRGVSKAYDIRKRNIVDVSNALRDHGVGCWIQGKTLKGIVLEGKLLDDNDDDFGVFYKDREVIRSEVSEVLVSLGFKKIRDTENVISFEREYRYVDICLFRNISNRKVGYFDKIFDDYHYESFSSIYWENIKLSIPNEARVLLKKMYPKRKQYKILRLFKGSLLSKIQRRIKLIPTYLLSHGLILLRHIPRSMVSTLTRSFKVIGTQIVELREEDFLNLAIEPEDSFNWKWRARHLNVVTENGKHVLIKDIVEYLSDIKICENIENAIVETDTSRPFYSPSNLDMDFWWGGNNFFWYCVKYEFRKNVTPYSEVNHYINSGREPFIYSAKYYESLPVMEDLDIQEFLERNPIEVRGNSIVGGKHRAFAMIGRLMTKKKYIPIKAVIINEK